MQRENRNRIDRILLLALYDFKGRYYGNYLGVFWALLNPALQIAIYYVVLTYILNIRTPDFIFYMFSGILLWSFFTEVAGKGLSILQSKKYLIENVGIQKFDLFISVIISGTCSYLIKFLAFIAISAMAGKFFFYTQLHWLIILVLNCAAFGMVFSLLNAVISSFIKDYQHLWALVAGMGIWINPIIIPIELYDQRFSSFRYYNPFAGILINIRETFMYGRPLDQDLFLIGLGSASVLMVIALVLFRIFNKTLIENYDTKQ